MKEPQDYLQINLLGADEQRRRLSRIYDGMDHYDIDCALIRDNANIYYLTGRVFRGYIYIDRRGPGPFYFVRQPSTLRADRPDTVFHIRKPEEIREHLDKIGVRPSANIALELDNISSSAATRLAGAFGMTAPSLNISPILRQARAVKTPAEQEKLIRSGQKHTYVYSRIPHQ